MASDAIARLGIAVVPEGRQCFPNLTVREHLVAFASQRNDNPTPWTLERIYGLFPRLAAAFDSADTNHDGQISYEEVRAFASTYRAERARLRAAQANTMPPSEEK